SPRYQRARRASSARLRSASASRRRGSPHLPPEHVHLERSGGVTTITIDRPPVNAMSRAVVTALESALDALATDATTHVALLPGGGGTQRLPRVVGPGRARLMIFSGEPISGHHAAEWGLVEEAVGPAEVFDTAAKIARTLAAQSPHSLAVIKALLRDTSGAPLRDGLRTEPAAFARLLAHPDARAGIAAFLGKREPRWAPPAGGRADA